MILIRHARVRVQGQAPCPRRAGVIALSLTRDWRQETAKLLVHGVITRLNLGRVLRQSVADQGLVLKVVKLDEQVVGGKDGHDSDEREQAL
jgi:hypothetical protein